MCGNHPVTVNCIGHTHIDVEWLWTRAQTREKIQRSFATAKTLMDKYLDESIKPDVEKLLELKMTMPEIGEGRRFDRLNEYLADHSDDESPKRFSIGKGRQSK